MAATTLMRNLPTVAAAVAAGTVLLGGAACGSGRNDQVPEVGNLRIVAMVHVPGRPIAVAAGEKAVWVTNNDAGSVSRIDPRTNRVTATIGVGDYPNSIAVGAGAVWVVARGIASAPNTYTVQRIDPATNRVTETVTVPSGEDVLGSIGAGPGGVWVLDLETSRVFRINPGTNQVVANVDVSSFGDVSDLAVGDKAVWVTGFDEDSGHGGILRINPATNRIVERISFDLPRCVAADAGGVWVTSVADDTGTISRIDPGTNRASWTARVGDDPCGVASGLGSVWAANSFKTGDTSDPPVNNRVFQVDPRTGAVTGTIAVSPGAGGGPSCPPCTPGPGGIAVGNGSVWVITDWWNSKSKNTVTRIGISAR